MDELIVDLFAGGGGTSTGIRAALGRDPDIAANHSAAAIAVHTANHPETRHYTQDVWEVDPVEVCGGRPVGLLWASPDCTHFSRAKGGKPKSKKIRSLAWVVTRWAKAVCPRVIALENVEEFQTWGPLLDDGRPDPGRVGSSFRSWVSRLRGLGYRVEWRSLCAADYGAPTTRRRLFLVARRDGQPIRWPEPTHGRGRLPWLPASSIIDWSVPCPSIFGRKKPLAEATLRRIAAGVRRYVIECARPFIAPTKERTISGNRAIVASFLAKHYGGVVGQPAQLPLGTVTAKDHHALVSVALSSASYGNPKSAAFLTKYYGTGGQQQGLFEPLHTVTSKARFGLVMTDGIGHQIEDIGMRMLSPRELFAAQGFPSDYVLDVDIDGRPITQTQLIALAGNSVPPPLAAAVVGAQFGSARRQEVA